MFDPPTLASASRQHLPGDPLPPPRDGFAYVFDEGRYDMEPARSYCITEVPAATPEAAGALKVETLPASSRAWRFRLGSDNKLTYVPGAADAAAGAPGRLAPPNVDWLMPWEASAFEEEQAVLDHRSYTQDGRPLKYGEAVVVTSRDRPVHITRNGHEYVVTRPSYAEKGYVVVAFERGATIDAIGGDYISKEGERSGPFVIRNGQVIHAPEKVRGVTIEVTTAAGAKKLAAIDYHGSIFYSEVPAGENPEFVRWIPWCEGETIGPYRVTSGRLMHDSRIIAVGPEGGSPSCGLPETRTEVLTRGGRAGPFHLSEEGRLTYLPNGADPVTHLPPHGDFVARLEAGAIRVWEPEGSSHVQVVLDHRLYEGYEGDCSEKKQVILAAGEAVPDADDRIQRFSRGDEYFRIDPEKPRGGEGYTIRASLQGPTGVVGNPLYKNGGQLLNDGERVGDFIMRGGRIVYAPQELCAVVIEAPRPTAVIDLHGKFVCGEVPAEEGAALKWLPWRGGVARGAYKVSDGRLIYDPGPGFWRRLGGMFRRMLPGGGKDARPLLGDGGNRRGVAVAETAAGALAAAAPFVGLQVLENEGVISREENMLAQEGGLVAMLAAAPHLSAAAASFGILSVPFIAGQQLFDGGAEAIASAAGSSAFEPGHAFHKVPGIVGGSAASAAYIIWRGEFEAVMKEGAYAVDGMAGLGRRAASQLGNGWQALSMGARLYGARGAAALAAAVAWGRSAAPIARAALFAAGRVIAPRAAAAGVAAVSDGPLPVGDVVGAALLVTGLFEGAWAAGAAIIEGRDEMGRQR